VLIHDLVILLCIDYTLDFSFLTIIDLKQNLFMLFRRLLQRLCLPLVLLLIVQGLHAQTKTVTGKVIDARDGSPIPGASIVPKKGESGTSTNNNGEFSLNVPSTVKSIVVTAVGFAPITIDVSTATQVSVSMTVASSNLNEVVVVGYGTARKKDVTGSVTTISSKDFVKGNLVSAEQLIAGKVAGVQITGNGGQPGSGSRIRIRGGASLNASNDPLIVIDGVPLDNSSLANSSNPLNLINPNDIESFNILKDASAAAIYGSRASNGVIIITTKRGKKGKPVFNFSTQLIVSTVAKKTDVLSGDEVRALVNERGNAGQKALLGTANTDWQDEIYRSAVGTDNNISMSGAINNKVPYRVSLAYLVQDGILRTDNFNRATASVNINPRLFNDHLKIDINLKGSYTKNRFGNQDAIGAAVAFDPTQPVKTNSPRFGGYFEWLDPSTGLPNVLASRNPLGMLEQKSDIGKVNRSIGNIQFDYKFHFLPELRANLNVGYDIAKSTGAVFIPDSAASDYVRKGKNTTGLQKKQNTLLDFYLNYVKDIKSIQSRVDVLVGYGYQDFIKNVYNFADFRANGELIPNSEPKFATDKPRNTLISVYSRLNYTFKNKYVLTATIRRDGSSRFAKDNRWGTFPSGAFAWKVSDEEFLKGSRMINNLKLRVGYGVTGQQNLNDDFYSYLPVYGLSENTALYQFGNTYYNMYRPSAYDRNIKWEETTTSNIGIDFAILNNRISGSVDYYFKETKDLLNTIPIPVGSNFSNEILTNVGNIENRGVEITINTLPINRGDFTWDLNFNVTFNRNKITKLTKTQDPNYQGVLTGDIAGGTGSKIQIHSVGYNTFSYFVWKQVYDKAGNPIEGLYEDLDGDGIITDRDKYRYKSSEPKALLGVSTGITYKKWTANAVMRGSFENYVYNNVYSNNGVSRQVLNPGNFLGNGSANLLETNFKNNQFFSDYYVQNASFFRMDNLSFGYDVGKVFNKRANLRITANVQNVFVISKYEGLDPEIANGVDNKFYPRPRTYVVGASLDF
jgi:TonB-dependent starch-binding outer membrane protein SusC